MRFSYFYLGFFKGGRDTIKIKLKKKKKKKKKKKRAHRLILRTRLSLSLLRFRQLFFFKPEHKKIILLIILGNKRGKSLKQKDNK